MNIGNVILPLDSGFIYNTLSYHWILGSFTIHCLTIGFWVHLQYIVLPLDSGFIYNTLSYHWSLGSSTLHI